MVSLGQIEAARKLHAEGWEYVPRSDKETRLGGPILMKKGTIYRWVGGGWDNLVPTEEQISKW